MFLKPEPSDSVQFFVSIGACVPKTKKRLLYTCCPCGMRLLHLACIPAEHPPNPHVSSFLFSPFLLTTAAVMKHQFDPAGNLRNFCPREGRISSLDSGRKLESKGGLPKDLPCRRTLLSSVSLGSRLHWRTVLLQTSAC